MFHMEEGIELHADLGQKARFSLTVSQALGTHLEAEMRMNVKRKNEVKIFRHPCLAK